MAAKSRPSYSSAYASNSSLDMVNFRCDMGKVEERHRRLATFRIRGRLNETGHVNVCLRAAPPLELELDIGSLLATHQENFVTLQCT